MGETVPFWCTPEAGYLRAEQRMLDALMVLTWDSDEPFTQDELDGVLQREYSQSPGW